MFGGEGEGNHRSGEGKVTCTVFAGGGFTPFFFFCSPRKLSDLRFLHLMCAGFGSGSHFGVVTTPLTLGHHDVLVIGYAR